MDSIKEILLEGFKISANSISVKKDGYLITSKKNKFFIKKLEISPGRILFVDQVKKHALKNGFDNLDMYMEAADGMPYYVHKDETYVLSRFTEGRECDFYSDKDVEEAVKLLGNFHKSAEGFKPDNDYSVYIKTDKIIKACIKRTTEIMKMKKFSEQRKSQYDVIYNNYAETMYQTALSALEILKSCDCQEYISKSIEKRDIAHNDYSHYNIILGNKSYIINFENCGVGVRVYDIATLLRKKLQKSNWDINKAYQIFNIYDSIYPLVKKDYMVLYGILAFPEKFWRISNKYYNSKKVCMNNAYLNKLVECVDELDNQLLFLKQFKNEIF